MPLAMRNVFQLDSFLTFLFSLVMPLLLFTTAAILSFSISNNILIAFESGIFGFIVGGILTVILRKFVFMTLFEIPTTMLFISYIIYVLFFYTLLQGIPFLVILAGVFVGMYYRRSFVVMQKPKEEFEFKVFQLSFLTAVTIGLLSLFTCSLIYFHLYDFEHLKHMQALIDSLPRPIAALVLITASAIISHIQFLLTKFTLLYKRPR